jgi:hypothetical protein
MPGDPFRSDSNTLDLHGRLLSTTTVVASPALAAETIIASLTIGGFGNMPLASGVRLRGWAAYTVGTSGTAVTLKIRRTNVSGTTVVSTGATNATATNLYALEVNGFDAAPGAAVYVLTMTVANGAAASTVSAVTLGADVV